MKSVRLCYIIVLIFFYTGVVGQNIDNRRILGANFIPSTAVNQLEMWQAETFDPITIDHDLGYAEGIGMNTMRVYLHHVAWQIDPLGFKNRVNQYLTIANKHHIKTMFVFADDCWMDTYHAGKQPDPVPSVHNSQWLKDPGSLIDKEPLLMDTLQTYVKDIMQTFGKDKRILMWDLYNEPGHFGRGEKSWTLLKNVVRWAREVKASQPITIGLWNPEFTAFNRFQLENSDVITFHNYRDTVSLKKALDTLVNRRKPVICTEYMKRPNGSTFENCLPIFKRYGVGAISWGLVAGKTQTNYPQGNKGGEPEPKLWYHDIFRKDGSPFDPREIEVIKNWNKDAGFHEVKFDKQPDWNFKVKLVEYPVVPGPSVFGPAKKLLVLSDIEGEFAALRSLLLANKVIDKQYNWIFGKGHLVIAGDLFDRGDMVPECLWLFYKLEQEAKAAGGYFHTLLGNHEIMNLSGDLRYVHPKYLEQAKSSGMDYMQLYSKNTVLGNWLRSKNVVECIGDLLFMHAGMSTEVLALHLPIEKINAMCRPFYDVKKALLPDSLKIFFEKESPFWYRGYFLEPRASMQVIDQTLKQYDCSKIIVGHTILDKNVAFYYQGKVLAVDVDEHSGHRAGALWTGNKWYKIDDIGKRVLLKYNPANDVIKAGDIL